MRYRKLDEDGDYRLGSQQADFHVDTPEAVAQAVATRLRLLAGEWFLDLAEGTPYQGGVWGKHTRATYDPVIRERILDTEGVTAIAAYDSAFDGDGRILTVSCTVETEYGAASVTEVL